MDTLLSWKEARYSTELKDLVEKCVFFKPEKRITAKDLLSQVERLMPMFVRDRLSHLTDPFAAETKVYTTVADLPNMTTGTHDFVVERDADFWDNLVAA